MQCLFSDEMAALKNLWLIGDEFLHEMYGSLLSLKNKAERGHGNQPYMDEYFNFNGY